MKIKRSYLITCLCCLLFASALGVIATTVAFSPSFGTYNSTAIIFPEEKIVDCVGCGSLVESGAAVATPGKPSVMQLAGLISALSILT
jgi:hypothetical protein